MAVGLFQIALAWFGLRRRQKWTLWTLAVADLVMIPYWLLIFQAYVSRGVPLSLSLVGVPLFIYPATIVPMATVLGWLGFRKIERNT